MNHSEQTKEPGEWTVESGSDRQGDVRIQLREIGDKTPVIECMTPSSVVRGSANRWKGKSSAVVYTTVISP